MAKKKLPKAEAPQTEVEVIRIVPEFSPQFREDLLWWAKTEPRLDLLQIRFQTA